MGHAIRAAALTLCVTAIVISALVPMPLGCGRAEAAPAAGKGAEQLASGIKSLQEGKTAEAVGTLSTAISSGALDGPQMAKALYYRGIARRKQGQSAQAISDLTSALFLKGGLSDTERADALEQRSAAYRDAGISDPNGNKAASAPPAPAEPAATSKPAVKAEDAKATKSRTAKSWQTETTAATPVAATAVPAVAADEGGAGASGTSSSISSFFGNLFGSSGASSTEQPATAPAGAASLTTASTGEPTTAVSSWSEATSLKASNAAPASTRTAATAAVPTVAPRPKKASAPSGTYRVQVASVRSRDAAAAVAARLKKEHGFRLDNREPVVEEAIFGNMGTFYSVRVGPYADEAEPGALCRVLRPSGFDCLILTQ